MKEKQLVQLQNAIDKIGGVCGDIGYKLFVTLCSPLFCAVIVEMRYKDEWQADKCSEKSISDNLKTMGKDALWVLGAPFLSVYYSITEVGPFLTDARINCENRLQGYKNYSKDIKMDKVRKKSR